MLTLAHRGACYISFSSLSAYAKMISKTTSLFSFSFKMPRFLSGIKSVHPCACDALLRRPLPWSIVQRAPPRRYGGRSGIALNKRCLRVTLFGYGHLFIQITENERKKKLTIMAVCLWCKRNYAATASLFLSRLFPAWPLCWLACGRGPFPHCPKGRVRHVFNLG